VSVYVLPDQVVSSPRVGVVHLAVGAWRFSRVRRGVGAVRTVGVGGREGERGMVRLCAGADARELRRRCWCRIPAFSLEVTSSPALPLHVVPPIQPAHPPVRPSIHPFIRSPRIVLFRCAQHTDIAIADTHLNIDALAPEVALAE
jgi:hypothetical protein